MEDVMYKRIMVPVDGSEGTQRALDEALKLAQLMQAQVQAVFVVEHPSQLIDVAGGFAEEVRPDDTASVTATAVLDDAHDAFIRVGVQGSVRAIDSYGDSVAAVLIRAIEEYAADLVVMHSHGRSGIKRLLGGSVAESLVRDTTVPLLLLRNGSLDQAAANR
jgi:nucleotide-binding universal stress UspA family protein